MGGFWASLITAGMNQIFRGIPPSTVWKMKLTFSGGKLECMPEDLCRGKISHENDRKYVICEIYARGGKPPSLRRMELRTLVVSGIVFAGHSFRGL